MIRKLRRLALLILVVCGVLIARHYWYSVKATGSLVYPEKPSSLLLKQQQDVIVHRGVLKEAYLFGLAAGVYTEVLKNEQGAFYLAPPLGFYERAGQREGFGVGGVYLPVGVGEPVYVWSFLLKNEKRSFSNPGTSRTLSKEHDQPERERFLDPDWYANKGFSLLGRPMIDKDFVVDRYLFVPSS